MAIQFNCPYCTASIRVPDSAAGKQGTCPKCSTKLIVPNVKPPAANPAKPPNPAKNTPAQEALPNLNPESEFPGIPTGLTNASEGPSMAQKVRKRGKRKRSGPLVPILMFSIVIGLMMFWMWKPQSEVETTLTAVRLPEFVVPAALIEKAVFALPSEEGDALWEELSGHTPAGVRDPKQFELLFEPTKQGLQLQIAKTEATEVFRVATAGSPIIEKYLSQHAEAIVQLREEEFLGAIKKFTQDWQTSTKNDLPFITDSYFLPVGFNRLSGVLGYSVMAQVGTRSYRCIHEDEQGNLYFLLPKDTDSFVLTGREWPDKETRFPAKFTVQVTETSNDTAPAPKTPEAEKTELPEKTEEESKTMEPLDPTMDPKTQMRAEN